MKHCVHPSDLAPGLMLGHDVEIGEDVELGGNVVIHTGTRDRRRLRDPGRRGARQAPAARRGTRRASRTSLEPLVVEAGAVVCAGAVVYAGARIGAGAVVGDQAQVRERASIGRGVA